VQPGLRKKVFIAPLQQTLLRRIIQLLAGVMLLWLVAYLVLNDGRMGLLVNTIVSGPQGKPGGLVRGKFRLGYAHYDYWTSLASVILNTAAPVRGGDFELHDPDGNLVMRIEEVRAEMYIGELVRSLLRTAVSAPFKRGVFVDLHFTRARVRGGHGVIQPTVSSLRDTPLHPEVNIVAAMASRKPSGPEPTPGRLLITIDGEGADLSDLTLELNFPSWYGRADGLSGNATLRFSSAAKENLPGKPAFSYEISPLRARSGKIVLGAPKDPGSFPFNLGQIELRRFGARPSHVQSLTFRGRGSADGAPFEISGALIDTYCDTGVDLEMSFEHAGVLARRAPGGLLSGDPRGRIRIFGPFSELPPTNPQTGVGPHPCLKRPRPLVPVSPDGRIVIIEGNVAGLDAEVASIRVTDAQSRLRLARGVLTLPSVAGAALGGQVRAEPMRIHFAPPLQFGAQVRVQGADPAQVGLLPAWMRPLVAGKLTGSVRLSGGLDREGKLDRVRLAGVEGSLSRKVRTDPYPREIDLSGDLLYTPESVSLRDVELSGEEVEVSLPRGLVGLARDRLDLRGVEVRGGPQAARVLQGLGVPATVRDLAASLQVGGTLQRPEIRGGVLAAHGLDLRGRRLDELVTGFTLQEGTLSLQGIQVSGMGGSASGQGAFHLFDGGGGIRAMLRDPGLRLDARIERVSAAQLLGLPQGMAEGDLSAQIELGGTVRRPTGAVSLQVPRLLIADQGGGPRPGAALRDLVMDTELRPEAVLINSLFAAVGERGMVNGNAIVRRDGPMPLIVTLNPQQLALSDIPFVRALPVRLFGDLTGSLRLEGTARPLRPTIDGHLALTDFRVTGLALDEDQGSERDKDAGLGAGKGKDLARVVLPGEVAPLPVEAKPLFRLLGMAVRGLSLGRAELTFRPEGSATRFRGTWHTNPAYPQDALHLSGIFSLDPEDPRGELTVRFGCPDGPSGAGPGRECDLAVERLLPELRQLADMEARVSGELTVRFGRGLPPLPGAVAAGFPPPATLTGTSALGALQATLRLSRTVLTVHTEDDDGRRQLYRVLNDGEVVASTDGQSMFLRRARFRSERIGGGRRSHGEAMVGGFLGPARSDLHIVGQIGLELIEQLVRATFKHTQGNVAMDVRLRGPMNALQPQGTAQVQGVRLWPQDLDVPIDVVSGRLSLSPSGLSVRDLLLQVEGASARVNGDAEVLRWAQLELGRLDFNVGGALSGRLLQWRFPRNFSEVRGQLALRGARLWGTLQAPRLAGTLSTRDLYLSVRRFHELHVTGGTLRFTSDGEGTQVIIGCGEDEPSPGGCRGGEREEGARAVQGTVDGEGSFWMSGRMALSSLAALRGPAWYDALARVQVGLGLSGVRHSAAGVYTVEVTTAGTLKLRGARDRLSMSGSVAVVSGRYVQPYDLKERFLARRVIEEEEPFWRGDPLLSNLELDLNVSTRGNFQVRNNIADLRLSASDFTLSGPLSDLAMGGTIRVDSGTFFIPGMRGEFQVKGDSKMEFTPAARWPETPWVDVRGNNVQFDGENEQRNVELALRGKVSELKIECISSDGLNAADCAAYLFLGGTSDQVRRALAGGTQAAGRPGVLDYSDNAARLLLSQVLTQQVEDPLREKLRLDTVRIQFGVSTFDLQLCKRFGLYLRACGLSELGLLAATSRRYRIYGEVKFSDIIALQVSFDRLERSLEFLEDTVNRFKLQLGLRRALHF
jgi:hypothetical protein